MWPTIPHPKDTLVQSCNPNTVCPSIFSLKRFFVHVCPHWWCPLEAITVTTCALLKAMRCDGTFTEHDHTWTLIFICRVFYWMSNLTYSASSKFTPFRKRMWGQMTNQNLWLPLTRISPVFPAPHRAPTAPGAPTVSAQKIWHSLGCWAGALLRKRTACRAPLACPLSHLGCFSQCVTTRKRGVFLALASRRRLMSQCPISIRLTSLCRKSEGQRPFFECSNLEDRTFKWLQWGQICDQRWRSAGRSAKFPYITKSVMQLPSVNQNVV